MSLHLNIRPNWLLALAWLLLSTTVAAQSNTYQSYQFPKQIPADYQTDPVYEYEELIEEEYGEVRKDYIRKFAEQISYNKHRIFTDGRVYMQFDQFEFYLNQLMQKILPDSIDGSKIKVYLSRIPELNAFAIHDGSLFINIMLLAEIKNEAALAVVMGHEITHYTEQDVINGFIENVGTKKQKRQTQLQSFMGRMHNSRQREARCDSFSILMCNAAGYDVLQGNSFLYQLMMDEEYRMQQGEILTEEEEDYRDSLLDPLRTVLSSHPETVTRVEMAQRMKARATKKGSKSYIISDITFKRLQRLARIETLDLLLKNNNFKGCIQKAFLYHLYDEEEDAFVYYLQESLRRLVYLYKGYWQEGFLTDDFPQYFKYSYGILNQPEFLIRDSAMLAAMSNHPLINSDTIEFNTYFEAWKYFGKLAIDREITEAYLSQALYYYHQDSLRKFYCDKYLKSPNIKFRAFAEALVDRRLKREIRDFDKEMLVVKDVNFLERHALGIIPNMVKQEKKSPPMIASLEQSLAKHYEHKDVLLLEDLRYDDFSKFMELGEVVNTTLFLNLFKLQKEYQSPVSYGIWKRKKLQEQGRKQVRKRKKKLRKNRKADLYILNPFCWQFVYENKITQLEILNLTAYDSKPGALGKTFNTINMINPYAWLRFYVKHGSPRYLYVAELFRFDQKTQKTRYHFEMVHYKLSKPNLANTVYHILQKR